MSSKHPKDCEAHPVARFSNFFFRVVLALIGMFAVGAIIERIYVRDFWGVLYVAGGCCGSALFIYIVWQLTLFNLDKSK